MIRSRKTLQSFQNIRNSYYSASKKRFFSSPPGPTSIAHGGRTVRLIYAICGITLTAEVAILYVTARMSVDEEFTKKVDKAVPILSPQLHKFKDVIPTQLKQLVKSTLSPESTSKSTITQTSTSTIPQADTEEGTRSNLTISPIETVEEPVAEVIIHDNSSVVEDSSASANPVVTPHDHNDSGPASWASPKLAKSETYNSSEHDIAGTFKHSHYADARINIEFLENESEIGDNSTTLSEPSTHAWLALVDVDSILKNNDNPREYVVLQNPFDEPTTEEQIMRREFESSLLADLPFLSAAQLRIRVTQLTDDLLERSRWETLRLQEAVAKVERDVTAKYSDLLLTQRLELENELSKKIEKIEESFLTESLKLTYEQALASEKLLSEKLKEQSEAFKISMENELKDQQTKLREQYEAEVNNHLALLRNEHVQDRMILQQNLSQLRSQLEAFNTAVNETDKQTKYSYNVHLQSAAIQAFEMALTISGKSIQNELELVKKTCSEDSLAQSLLNALPTQVLNKGAPQSLSELRYRFRVMRKEIRREALAPPQLNGLVGSLIGTALAMVTTPPEGNVVGDGAEEVLARVNLNLEQGKLNEAYREMMNLKGYARELAHDWLIEAENRLVVEQTVRALRANNILGHLAVSTN